MRQTEALQEEIAGLKKRNKELSWQIKMSQEGGGVGGDAAQPGVNPARLLSLFKCTAARQKVRARACPGNLAYRDVRKSTRDIAVY